MCNCLWLEPFLIAVVCCLLKPSTRHNQQAIVQWIMKPFSWTIQNGELASNMFRIVLFIYFFLLLKIYKFKIAKSWVFFLLRDAETACRNEDWSQALILGFCDQLMNSYSLFDLNQWFGYTFINYFCSILPACIFSNMNSAAFHM